MKDSVQSRSLNRKAPFLTKTTPQDASRFIKLSPAAGGGVPCLQLRGAWTIYNAAAIENAIHGLDKNTTGHNLDCTGIEELDTAGAWLIKKHFRHNDGMDRVSDKQRALLDYLPDDLSGDAGRETNKKNRQSAMTGFFANIGEGVLNTLGFLYALCVFIGKIFTRFLINFSSPRRFRFPSIIRHIYEAGLKAVPIVALLAFLMSMVISYQAAVQLQKFGADIFMIDLGVISILREMGVLITSIMVAGRSGSAFAAEIGVMKLREEVDALKTIGMDPIEVLVLPRVIALVIALPLLTFIADLVGIAGGGVMAYVLLDIPYTQFLDRAENVATFTMFFVGMIKAPVFAFLIAVIGTYQGMNVSGSAESVGRLTTVSVVQSIFLVIMADALFSVIFSEAGL